MNPMDTVIHKEGAVYTATATDFPEIHAEGPTAIKALEALEEAIKEKPSCDNCTWSCQVRNIWEKGNCLSWRKKRKE